MKKLLLLAVLVAAAIFIPASASAGKSIPTVSFTPNPSYPQMPYRITGCGYPPSTTLRLALEESWKGYYVYYFVPTDTTGCFDYGTFAAGAAGTTVDVDVYHGSKEQASAELQTIGWTS